MYVCLFAFLQGQRSVKFRENTFQYRIKHILILTLFKRHSSPIEKHFPTIWHSSVVSSGYPEPYIQVW